MREIPDVALNIGTGELCYVIVKVREFETKDQPSGLASGSNPSDDAMRDVLEMWRNDPVFEELHDFIAGLNEDQQIDLVALAWVGRGDYGIGEWTEARTQAAAAHNDRTADYLLGMPLLSEFLEDAMSALGLSCEDEEMGRL